MAGMLDIGRRDAQLEPPRIPISTSPPAPSPVHDAFAPAAPEQWWYWTGHLEDDRCRRYAFTFAFFVRQRRLRGQMVHFGLTDAATGVHRHRVDYRPNTPVRLPSGFALWNLSRSLRAAGGAGLDHLHAQLPGVCLDLDLQGRSPPVPHYDGGWQRYSFGGHSAYYSRVDMEARGSLRIGGRRRPVRGSAWFDRQYGDLHAIVRKSWRWFALLLDDGRRIMLNVIDGHPEDSTGSIVLPDGRQQRLAATDFVVHARDHWRSPRTGHVHPVAWDLGIAGETLHLRPYAKQQEVPGFLTYPTYWEGGCWIEGDARGHATVEVVTRGETPLRSRLRAWACTAGGMLLGW